MPKAHDLTGKKFNRLLVSHRTGKQGSHILWLCVCDCGRIVEVTANNLVQGRSGSCGCFASEVTGARAKVHGMYGTPAHRSWRAMMDRCTNPTSPNYARYGGAGIRVCGRWCHFAAFYEDMGDRPAGTTLDRIEGTKGYEPGNCRWATGREQRMNQARGTIGLDQAVEVRRLHSDLGWKSGKIAAHLGISVGAASGVIYLGNLSP